MTALCSTACIMGSSKDTARSAPAAAPCSRVAASCWRTSLTVGIGLGICTNKPAAITERTLAELDLARWFGAVVGETPSLARKPDAAMLLAALDQLGARPEHGVMIGDSAADVGAARAAGVPVIAVSFGYTTTPARELGADAVIDHLSELPAAVARLA